MAFIVDPHRQIDGICLLPQDQLKQLAEETMADSHYKENDFTPMCQSIIKQPAFSSKQRIALAKMIVYSGLYDEDELEGYWNL
jgi:hypothetical protein